MNSRLIMIISAIAAGAGLLVGGGYLTIDNIIEPQGYLFEGIVLSALGIITLLMVVVAVSIGKTILMFIDIMQKQITMQQKIRDISSPGLNISDVLKNMMPGTNITSIDVSSPVEIPDSLKSLIKNLTPGTGDLDEMGMEDLEKELSKAVKKDDFERAEEINKAIKKLKSLGGPEDPEEKTEE